MQPFTVNPALATAFTAVVAWLCARYGRKVRLKVGEIEIEAQTVEQAKTLLNYAEEFQQRNQRRQIHEP